MSKVTDPEAICADSDSTACNGHSLSADEPAEWISGAQWADELDVPPETPIARVVGTETWKAVRAFNRKYGIENVYYGDDGMSFADLEAIPVALTAAAKPSVAVTRGQVAEFATDLMTDDPHEIGELWKRDRSQRFREKDRAERALKAVSVAATTEYTFDTVESAAGPEIAAGARELVDRANRRAWNTPKPHSFAEHQHLISAVELHARLGVPVSTLATMTAATEQQRDSALDELAVRRRHHSIELDRASKALDVPHLNLLAETLSVDGLAALVPVAPLIQGFLYRGQLAELIGEPGAGKTFAALAMALSIASGRRWCGFAVPESTPVIYVAAEGANGLHLRLLAWCAVHDVNPASLQNSFYVVPRAVQMGEDEHMRQVTELVQKVGAGLVVFDTRARCTVGLEENSATDQGRAIARADDLIQQTGAAVLVVHHTAANSDRGRGSTAWDGALYSSLRLSRTNKGAQIECVKHKDAESGCKHQFRLAPHTVNASHMGGATPEQRNTMVLLGIASAGVDDWDDMELPETQEKVVALVEELGGEMGLSRREVVQLGQEQKIGSRSAIYGAIKGLESTGRLKKSGDKRAGRFTVVKNDGATDGHTPQPPARA